MIIAKSSVTALATTIGILLLNRPKRNHSKVPVAKREYINNEMPVVSFVRIVLIACGRKDAVVRAAAAKPKIVIASISFLIVKCTALRDQLFCKTIVKGFSS